ncbi:MAG TPA: hypothetical protein DCL21_05025 [Alphaproteobacteria bacterium]|nr:hypothetical protein [Alphaproteobacteria bacterium]
MIKKTESTKTKKSNDEECSCKGEILIAKTAKVIEHSKQYIFDNYKKPKFIIISLVILIALIGVLSSEETTVKYHFLKTNIVKEVITNGHSEYFFCRKDLEADQASNVGFFITCNKQLIEN